MLSITLYCHSIRSKNLNYLNSKEFSNKIPYKIENSKEK